MVASLYDAAIDECLAGRVCLIKSEIYGGFPDELLSYTRPDAAAFNRMATVYQQVFGHPTDVVLQGLQAADRGRARHSVRPGARASART
ncbi:hypothetical protein ACFV4F_27050 [Kitasatospora sp. NPDC059722]|uniref:hypothetical protein n=1 Tax=Kitasatospora sp. NPDC059722 TaxID=3346925 RepID=UPI0036C429B9